MAERFRGRGDMEGYEREAQEFLKAHPRSEFAPRAALDLFIYATAADRKELAEEMRVMLALEYPESMQGAYLRTTFAKDEDYRKLLVKLLERNASAPREDFPRKYQRALAGGIKQFGKALLNDSDFLLKSAIIVGATGDAASQRSLLAAFTERAKDEETLRKIAVIAADENKTAAERATALHAESENATAAFLRDFFLSRLSMEEKESAAIRRVTAESLLVKSKFSDALPLLEKLPAGADAADAAKILFQRILCHATKGESAKIAALQAELNERHAESPWRERGRAVMHAVDNAEKNMGLYAVALHEFIADAKQHFAALECTIVFDRGDAGKRLSVYLALSAAVNFMEVQVRDGDELKLAYKSGGKDSAIFMMDDPVIHRFLQPGPVPAPVLNLERNKDGSFSFTFNAQFQTGFQGVAAGNQKLLDSPFLNSREGAMELVRSSARTAVLLGDVTDSDGGKKFALVFPDVRKPESDELGITVSANHRISALRMGKFECRDIRYGPADTVKFSPPPWPEVKTVTAEQFDIPYFFKVFGKIAEMFSSEKKDAGKTQ